MPTDALLPPFRDRLIEVARVFARLGFTAFGGPAAHVAMIEDEVVTRRRWLDRGAFLDLVSAVNFIPGPNSTELAIHLGLIRAGFPGLVVAGVCFITPAVLIILPLAWLYVTRGSLPQVRPVLDAVDACVVAVIAAALVRLARAGLERDRFAWTLAACAAAAVLVLQARRLLPGYEELAALAAAAVAGAAWHARPAGGVTLRSVLPTLLPAIPTATAAGRAVDAVALAAADPARGGEWVRMALLFLKIGATLFGSGYVLASYLRSGLVDQHAWFTAQQVNDAVAVGQITPGPLLTTATFVGYVLGHQTFGGGVPGGIAGAAVATAAIFAPSFAFVAVLGRVLPRVRGNRLARGALDGMNAAVVTLIFVVLLRLGHATLAPLGSPDAAQCAIAAATVAMLLGTRLNATWLIAAAAAAGAVRCCCG